MIKEEIKYIKQKATQSEGFSFKEPKFLIIDKKNDTINYHYKTKKKYRFNYKKQYFEEI